MTNITNDQTTDTNTKTATAATQPEALPLAGLTLLGTILAPKGARALLRQSGRIKQVSTGDRIGGHVVTSIDSGSILLARNGQVQALRVPCS
ncbi:MAG: hypothetical protein R3D81_05975 [Thalassovita sp.]